MLQRRGAEARRLIRILCVPASLRWNHSSGGKALTQRRRGAKVILIPSRLRVFALNSAVGVKSINAEARRREG